MNFTMMVAITAFCAETATFGAPVAVAQGGASEALAVETVAVETVEPNGEDKSVLPAPEAGELREAPIKNTEDNLVLDEEQFNGALAFDGESDDNVVARFVSALEGIDTLQGDFTQVAPSGAVSTGKFFLRRPGLLRFEYDAPDPLLIVANSGIVYVRDDALETTDSYPVGRTPLKFLLDDRINLADAEVLSVDRGIDTVAVTLASQDEETEGEISIIMSAPALQLRRWIVRDVQNGITVVTLDDVVAGERIANRLFRAPDAGGQFLKN